MFDVRRYSIDLRDRYNEYGFWNYFYFTLLGGLLSWILGNVIVFGGTYVARSVYTTKQVYYIIVSNLDFSSLIWSFYERFRGVFSYHEIVIMSPIGLIIVFSLASLFSAVPVYVLLTSIMIRITFAISSSRHLVAYVMAGSCTYIAVNVFAGVSFVGFAVHDHDATDRNLLGEPFSSAHAIGLTFSALAGLFTWIVREVVHNDAGSPWLRRIVVVPLRTWRRRGLFLLLLLFLADLTTYRFAFGTRHPEGESVLDWHRSTTVATDVVEVTGTRVRTPILPCTRYRGLARYLRWPWQPARAGRVEVIVDLPGFTPAPWGNCRPPSRRAPDRAMILIMAPDGRTALAERLAHLPGALAGHSRTRPAGLVLRERVETSAGFRIAEIAYIVRGAGRVDVLAECDSDTCWASIRSAPFPEVSYQVSAAAFWADPAKVDADLRALAMSFLEP